MYIVKVSALLLFAILPFCSSQVCEAQKNDGTYESRRVSYEAGLQGLAATDRTPFWLRANRFGTVTDESPVVMPQLVLQSDYRAGTRWDWGFKVDAIGQFGATNRILLPEAHIKARWKKIEIFGGRKRQTMGLVGDSLNTSGSYVQSGNALPIPMIQIGATDFIPFFNDLVAIKANFAHGWFDNNEVVKQHYLHQKSLYGRLGRSSWPVRIYGGLNHQVQWGGSIVTPNRWTAPGQTRYPQKWRDYWWVITTKKIPTFGYVNLDEYDAVDRGNRLGNHLGTVDVGLEILNPKWTLLFYRQNIYEDGSLFQLINLRDGLNGVGWKNLTKNQDKHFYLQGVTLEHLYTIHQGGENFDLNGGIRGRDEYFSHIQYLGWVYSNKTIGTPFISAKGETREDLPQPTKLEFTNNNRVSLWHLGANGSVGKLQFLLKTSYSENRGSFGKPFGKKIYQFSGLLRVGLPVNAGNLGQMEVFGELANDTGRLLPNSTGVMLGIRKSGIL